MRFLSNAHTHTPYCDGRTPPAEMIAEAARLGFVSLGFSGHADQGFDDDYSMGHGKQEEYRKELRALQARQRNTGEGPCLWVGLEQDGLVSAAQKAENRTLFDYVLGSTHYLCGDFHGEPVAVDGDLAALKAYAKEACGGDWMGVAKAYFDAHVAMLLKDRPHIIGHFDLVRKHAKAAGLFDPDLAAYRRLALEALTAAYPCGGVLEVNTGGMARGFVTEPYPTFELLARWRELGGAVTLTSDCHEKRLLSAGLDEAMERLKALGYRTVLRLGTGRELWEEVAL